jgi:hypothetical protein
MHAATSRRLNLLGLRTLLIGLAACVLVFGHQAITAADARTNVPLTATVTLSKDLAEIKLAKVKVAGQEVWGQLTPPGLLNDAKPAGEGEVLRELHFVVPKLEDGQALEVEARLDDSLSAPEQFEWKPEGDKHID